MILTNQPIVRLSFSLIMLIGLCFTAKTQQFTCGTSLLKDIDGFEYHTVHIGTRCWTKENMRTTRYSDGKTAGIRNTIPQPIEQVNMPGVLVLAISNPCGEQLAVEMYNLIGERLYRRDFQCAQGSAILKCSIGPDGEYLVCVSNGITHSCFKVFGNNGIGFGVTLSPVLPEEPDAQPHAASPPHYYYDYNNDPENDIKFGKLYTEASALNLNATSTIDSVMQGICPDGWHVANDWDFMNMEVAIGMDSVTVYSGWFFEPLGTYANKLKTPDTTYWHSDFGTDDVGFSARGAGSFWVIGGIGFQGFKERATWFTYNPAYDVLIRQITDFDLGIYRGMSKVGNAHSVRCVKN